MQVFIKPRHIVLAFATLALVMLLAKPGRTAAVAELEGRLEDVTGDAEGFRGQPIHRFEVLGADGRRRRVRISRELLRQAGGVRKLRGRQLRLNLKQGPQALSADGFPAEEVDGIAALDGGGSPQAADAISGSKPWLAILVRFGDNSSTPQTPAWFSQRLSTPNQFMDKIWRENSYDMINVVGSQVAGWYTLPQPRSYYVYDNNGDGQEDADLNRIAEDAIALADADVHFPTFSGVQVMLNDGIGCCAWGGARNINRDGVNRSYSFTWMPPWAFQQLGILAHEMGHGFGLPHSSGPYGQTYDSKWDFMSSGYGDAPSHTISYHKNLLEWIPNSRRYEPAAGSVQEIFIERIAFPARAAGTWSMAKLPISGGRFYTVESRLKQGYDNAIPAEGIVLHDVDPSRSSDALVVDTDNNGNVNDAGAAWTAGESFFDSANNIRVEVLSSNANGHQVRISYKAGGATSTHTPTRTATSTLTPTPWPGTGNGVCASYWSNMALSGTACAMRGEANIDFNWAAAGPAGTACGPLSEQFSARMTGQLEAPYTGNYTLYLRGDDGIRLWVTNPANGAESQLINQWILQSATEYSAALPFSLNAGQKAAFRVEYFENGGDAVLQFSWSGPNTPKQAIPQNRLYSGVCAPPTHTATSTSTRTSTRTWTSSHTPTHTPTVTHTPTRTFTLTHTNTFTHTGTNTHTPTDTATVPVTLSVTETPPTATSTDTSTDTRTSTPVPPTDTATLTRTNTLTYTNSHTFTNTRTLTPVPPTHTHTNTYTNTRTNTPVPPTFTPTNTPTRTNTSVPPTATPTPTRTNTPVTPPSTLSVKYKNVDVAASSGSPYPQFQITNGGAAVPLNQLELRYWLTGDGAPGLQAWLDWASLAGAAVDLVSTNLGGQTHYLRVRFNSTASLASGATVEVQTRFNRSDWGMLTQTNDWSFAPYTAFTSWNKVTLYRSGAKVWGLEPGASAIDSASLKDTPTPGTFLNEKLLVAGPNPAKDELHVVFQGSSARLRLAIYNLNQELVTVKDLGLPGTGELRETLAVRGLATGLYWMALEEDSGGGWRPKSLFKVVIKH